MWKGSITPSWSAGRRTAESWTSNPPQGCTALGSSCWLSHQGARTCSRTPPLYSRCLSPPHSWRRARRKRKVRRRRAWRNPSRSWRSLILTLFPLTFHRHPQSHQLHLRSSARRHKLCHKLKQTHFTSSKHLLQTFPLPKNLLFSDPHKALAAQSRIHTCSSTAVSMCECVDEAPAPFNKQPASLAKVYYSKVGLFCIHLFIVDTILPMILLIHTKASLLCVKLLGCLRHFSMWSWCYLLLMLDALIQTLKVQSVSQSNPAHFLSNPANVSSRSVLCLHWGEKKNLVFIRSPDSVSGRQSGSVDQR